MIIVKLDANNYFTGYYADVESEDQNPFVSDNYAITALPTELSLNKNTCYKLKTTESGYEWEFDLNKYNYIIANTPEGKIASLTASLQEQTDVNNQQDELIIMLFEGGE